MLKFLFVIFLSPLAAASNLVGQLKSTTDDYPYNYGPPTQTLIPYVSLELSDKYKLDKAWHLQWKAFALSNTSTHYSPENFYGDIHEAFVEYKSGGTKLQLGMNTINWAVVDVSSPSDVVSTLALFHPLRTTKQGAPMVQAQFGHEQLNLDLIYMPVQRRPELPSKDSRWLPRDILIQSQGNEIVLPRSLEYEYTRAETYTHALNNNAGAKLASHLGSWDLQITHFEGASPTPKIIPTIDADPPPLVLIHSPIHLTPITYRVSTTGLGFVWARENWIYRGESVYQNTLSPDDALQPWSWTSVLAVETNIEILSKTVTLLGQAYYTKNPQVPDNLIASAYRLFDHTGVLGVRFAYSDDLTFMLSGLYDIQTQGLFALASFDQKLTDHLRWGLTWRNFSAAKDGLLKTYAKDSHGTMDLTYFF